MVNPDDRVVPPFNAGALEDGVEGDCFGTRIMFGTDQMYWPDEIGLAVEGVDSARDIFHGNAVRFFRLETRLSEQEQPVRRP